MPLQFLDCTFAYRAGTPVIDALTMAFPAGCTVLLGPNGAGKSTLLSLGASALNPDSGEVRLGRRNSARGRDRRGYRQAVGWLPQQVKAIPSLTVREQAAYVGWLKGLSRAEAWERSAAALARVRLTELSERGSHELSGGQLRRLGIAQTLVHEAQVVLLDEPTAGLDPVQRGIFRDLLAELSSSVNFIVSTHQTEDLADIYDTVVVFDRGRPVFEGSVPAFFATAPADVAPERRAESAYRGLVRGEV
ncbi:ATP-binding cassette domain-containing protein [Streptomyces sp. SP18CS02]|uniref:ATP-binding cassette domain-containing protein n=1 Tax=Streptomyces sp. SP18CS02 TaxID=3002531 RepID=UPI002E76BAC5|nr:ATP-binding cassette domain-containing protein [Streptomyces sp. SP18CS02]MEE1753010.1 ATP-binding cassette domain-containing protein [Streptomyces sp. SP18CS02]